MRSQKKIEEEYVQLRLFEDSKTEKLDLRPDFTKCEKFVNDAVNKALSDAQTWMNSRLKGKTIKIRNTYYGNYQDVTVEKVLVRLVAKNKDNLELEIIVNSAFTIIDDDNLIQVIK